MKKIIYVLFIFLIHESSSEQNFSLIGNITNKQTGEALIGASIVEMQTHRGTAANEYGFFQLKLTKGTHQLLISTIGFHSKKIDINILSDTIIDIQLDMKISELQEVKVKANSREKQITNPQTGLFVLDRASITKLSPSLLGEEDVLKSLQTLSGVQGGREGVTQLSVRGGDPGQNLILLDGVPVFYTSHLFGFLSVFSTDAIKQVKLYKGGFPARYGGRLSSVIDIRLKEGNQKQYKSKLDIGLLSSKLTVEGPISKKMSFIVSGRTTPLSASAWAYQKMEKVENLNNYYFYDLTAKINYKISHKDRLYLSFYSGNDIFKSMNNTEKNDTTLGISKISFRLNWDNLMGLLRWNHIYNNNIFSNLSVVYSQYNFGVQQRISGKDKTTMAKVYNYDINRKFSSKVNQMGIHWDFYANPFLNYDLRVGVSSTNYRFQPNALDLISVVDTSNNLLKNDTAYNTSNILYSEINAYIENIYKIGKRIELNAGFRYNQIFVDDTSFISLEPRATLSFIFTPSFSFKLSYAYMQQNLHLLGNSTLGLPTDIWIPATKKIPPENSQQISAGFFANIFKTLSISTEIFYKKLNKLAEFKAGANFLRDGSEVNLRSEAQRDWQNNTIQGIGKAYGMDFSLNKTEGKWKTSLSYGLLWSWRKFDQLNNGNVYPYRYGRRHKIDINFSYNFNSRIILNANWQYSSGFYVSIPFSKYPAYWRQEANFYSNSYIENNTLYSYEEIVGLAHKNNFQTPVYHRLDINLSFRKVKKKGIRTWNLGVYNVYNRQNPFSIFVSTSRGKLSQITLFPILPSISYKYEF